jgi:hypothetical protein
MKAITTVEFKGVPDNEVQAKTFKVDDPVSGDLAVVAVREKWATEVKENKQHTKEKAIDDMTTDELIAHAAANKIDLKGATKRADILAAIQAAGKK